jgi:hypothetical protein
MTSPLFTESRLTPLAAMTKSGHYYPLLPTTSLSASLTLGIGTLRLHPFVLLKGATLAKLVADVVTAGEAGATYRMGVYADDGTGYPGALAWDTGSVAADTTGTKEVGSNVTLLPGLYWVGGAVQNVVTTQPNMRVVGTAVTPQASLGTSLPAGGLSSLGYLQTAVTGALPATFTTTVGTSSQMPRLLVKVA